MAAPVSTPASFFVRDGEQFIATELTRGPWHPQLQHGGPPAALLTAAIEAFEPEPQQHVVARLTFEFLRPVPIASLRVTTELVRAGRSAQRIDAHLLHDGTEVLRVHALRIRRNPVALPSPRCPRRASPRGPAGLEPFVFPFFRERVGYQAAVEVRIAKGVWGKGPTAAWMRLRAPLVADQATSPLSALVAVADAGNGVCPVLDPREWSFVNPDMTIHLDRAPCGEWFALDARATVDAGGIGLGQSELSDRDGEIGRALQSLAVEPRAH